MKNLQFLAALALGWLMAEDAGAQNSGVVNDASGANVRQVQTSGDAVQPTTPQNIPYYVEPSRFYYNRPSQRNFSNTPQRQSRNFTYQLRPGYYYFGYAPCPPYCGYYAGPTYYYPRVYPVAPGVTEHIGPFIPIR